MRPFTRWKGEKMRGTLWVLCFFSTLVFAGQQDPLMSLMMSQPKLDTSAPVVSVAAFEPPTIRQGEQAIYRVTFNALEEAIVWPAEIRAEPALELQPRAHGQILQMSPAGVEPRTSFNYRVRVSTPGDYIVPEFEVQVSAKPVKVPAARLHVGSSSDPAGPPAQQLFLEVPVTNLFAGQPTRVRVVCPPPPEGGIASVGQIELSGSGFISDLGSVRPGIDRTHNSGRMPATTYDIVITPITVGKLTVFAQGISLGNRFGGPMMIPAQTILPQSPTPYSLLDSDPVEIEVRPLPQEGKLPGFAGAIGVFMMEPPRLSTNTVQVGQPMKLSVYVRDMSGLGRIAPPPPPSNPDWQIFAGSADASPGPIPGRGVGLFNFTLVPLTATAYETPPIPYSYFDPEHVRYVDLSIPTMPITVRGSSVPVDLAALRKASEDTSDTNREPVLSSLASEPGRGIASLTPLGQRPFFPLVQVAPAAALIGLWSWDRRRRYLEKHPHILLRRRARRALRREIRRVDQAIRAGDAREFASSAVNAMRVACAPHFPAEARALVGSDVLSILNQPAASAANGHSLPETAAVLVRRFFDAADASRFANKADDTRELLALRPQLDVVFNELEARLC
jgi:hypothetical protein